MRVAVIVEVDLDTVHDARRGEGLMGAILTAARGTENPPAPTGFKIIGRGITVDDVKRFVTEEPPCEPT